MFYSGFIFWTIRGLRQTHVGRIPPLMTIKLWQKKSQNAAASYYWDDVQLERLEHDQHLVDNASISLPPRFCRHFVSSVSRLRSRCWLRLGVAKVNLMQFLARVWLSCVVTPRNCCEPSSCMAVPLIVDLSGEHRQSIAAFALGRRSANVRSRISGWNNRVCTLGGNH